MITIEESDEWFIPTVLDTSSVTSKSQEADCSEQVVDNSNYSSINICASSRSNRYFSSSNTSRNRESEPESSGIPLGDEEQPQLNKINQTVSTPVENTADSTNGVKHWLVNDAVVTKSTVATATEVNLEQTTSSLSISTRSSSSKDSTLVALTNAPQAPPEAGDRLPFQARTSFESSSRTREVTAKSNAHLSAIFFIFFFIFFLELITIFYYSVAND